MSEFLQLPDVSLNSSEFNHLYSILERGESKEKGKWGSVLRLQNCQQMVEYAEIWGHFSISV